MGLFGKKGAFKEAIREGNIAVLKELLEKHPEYLNEEFNWYPNDDYDEGNCCGCPIHMAAAYNRPDVIAFFVKEKGVSVDVICGADTSDWTPLFQACRWQKYEAAEMLLKLGADPDIKGIHGYPPAIYCRTERLQTLLAPARMFAEGDMEKIRERLEKYPEYVAKWRHTGGNIAKIADEGDALLHIAARHGRVELVELLVREKGVPVDLQNDKTGWTALHYAAEAGHIGIAEALLRLGASTEVAAKNGKQPDACARSSAIKELFLPMIELREEKALLAQRKKEEQEAAGIWRMVSDAEVMRERKMPGDGLMLTDIFNFETRRWTAISKDPKSGHLAQNILFFDDVSDREELRRACAKLAELGGSPDSGSIEKGVLQKQRGKGPDASF